MGADREKGSPETARDKVVDVVDGDELVVPVFRKVTDCSECPCRNRDYESGSDCNLDYEMDLEYRNDKELIYCSDNCNLIDVNYGNFTRFTKDKALVTKTRPASWKA